MSDRFQSGSTIDIGDMAKKRKSTPTAAPLPPAAMPSASAASQVQPTSSTLKSKKKKGENLPRALKILETSVSRVIEATVQGRSLGLTLRHIQKHRKLQRLPRMVGRLKPLKVRCSMPRKLQSPCHQHQRQKSPFRRQRGM